MKNPFIQLRPMLRIARALEDIARALTYFAVSDARTNNRFYLTRPGRYASTKDESELLHTDPLAIAIHRQEQEDLLLQRGLQVIDEEQS